jgi:hypothetical protein
MKRRLPHEPKELLKQLTVWIEWRYAGSARLVLTSAPTSIPAVLERWRPSAVWRLAWEADGTAALYGLAPGDTPTKYFIVRHDARDSRSEGLFELQSDGTWQRLEGDNLHSGMACRLPIKIRRPDVALSQRSQVGFRRSRLGRTSYCAEPIVAAVNDPTLALEKLRSRTGHTPFYAMQVLVPVPVAHRPRG